MPQVIAFAGKIGSGKTTITKCLADALGWPRASFGDYVRKAVRERGLGETREVLQSVGTELLRASPPAFCNSVLQSSGWKLGNSLLIDGLRHAETIEIIQGLTQVVPLSIVFVRISEDLRLRRLEEREGWDANYRAVVEAHSSEAQVTSALAGAADFVVDNDGPIRAAVSEVAKWIKSRES
jgi:dephospho-CoA kinase